MSFHQQTVSDDASHMLRQQRVIEKDNVHSRRPRNDARARSAVIGFICLTAREVAGLAKRKIDVDAFLGTADGWSVLINLISSFTTFTIVRSILSYASTSG